MQTLGNTLLRLLLFALALIAVEAAAPVIEKHPQKDLILQSLQRLVDERSKASENHFFILRRTDGQDWIYWREGRLLWATELVPYSEKKGPAELRARAVWDMRLRRPWKPIDLDTGVVPTREDIGSSTYLVSKDFVADIVFDCVLDGELLVVRKKKSNKSPDSTPRAIAPPVAQESRRP